MALCPLRVEELAEVLALDVDAGGIPTFNAKWRWEDHEAAVLFACSSLVSVIVDHGSRVVQFSHFSVKEFLTSDRLTSMEDVSQFYIADEPSHLILSQACLGVMLSMDFRTSENSVKDIALLPYADEYWIDHSRVGEVELRIKDALDCFFNLDEPHFEALIRRNYDEDFFRHFRVPSDEDPKGVLTAAILFYVASLSGLRCLAERLIVSNQQQIIGFRVQGWTLLHLIVGDGDPDVGFARLLLAHGADVNSRPHCATRTPPHIASLQSQSHVESVDGTDEIKNSPQISGSDVSSESSEESSDDGLDFGYNKKSGFTPLHIAVSKGHLDMCQMLLDHKADVRAQDNKGNTPLHFAASEDHFEVAHMLLEHKANVNAMDKEGSTPLQLAFEGWRADIVRLLLNHGAEAKVNGKCGNTLLHVAVLKRHIDICRILLGRNAEINFPNDHGSTPLLIASKYGPPDLVQLLLDHNADLDLCDSDGNTPLHYAAFGGQVEVALLLLKLNVDVNSRNKTGSTPLHLASAGFGEGHPDVVRLLLDHSADTQARNLDGETASEVAHGEKWQEIVQLLSEHAAE